MIDTPQNDRGDDPGPRLSDEDRALAAEYALHLLGPEERADFESRLGFSKALRDEVARWEAQFAEIAETEVQPVAPSPMARAGLMRTLFPRAARPPFWQRAGLWQGLSLAGFAAAGAMGFLLITQPDAPAPLLVGEIVGEGDSLRLLALYDGADGSLRLTRTDGTAPAGRVLELWALTGPDDPAISLGLLDETGQGAVSVPPRLRGQAGGLTLAVSEEPPGGSPTGQPTGQVLAIGGLTDL